MKCVCVLVPQAKPRPGPTSFRMMVALLLDLPPSPSSSANLAPVLQRLSHYTLHTRTENRQNK